MIALAGNNKGFALLTALLLASSALAIAGGNTCHGDIDYGPRTQVCDSSALGYCDAEDDECTDWPAPVWDYLDATCALPVPAHAEDVRLLVDNILADAEFGGERDAVTWTWEWRFKGSNKKEQEQPPPFAGLLHWLEKISGWLGLVGHILLWSALLLVLLVVWRKRALLRNWLPGPRAATPERIAGIDITPLLAPDALPDDVVAAARHLWQQGYPRAALGLLYRAALHHLGDRHGIAIPASGTELECLRRVERHADARSAAAFARLVQAWMRCAYAHAMPATLEPLVTQYLLAVSSETRAPGDAGSAA